MCKKHANAIFTSKKVLGNFITVEQSIAFVAVWIFKILKIFVSVCFRTKNWGWSDGGVFHWRAWRNEHHVTLHTHTICVQSFALYVHIYLNIFVLHNTLLIYKQADKLVRQCHMQTNHPKCKQRKRNQNKSCFQGLGHATSDQRRSSLS